MDPRTVRISHIILREFADVLGDSAELISPFVVRHEYQDRPKLRKPRDLSKLPQQNIVDPTNVQAQPVKSENDVFASHPTKHHKKANEQEVVAPPYIFPAIH